ncbi:MAG: type III-B CRISPR module RAMP protein Cmr4 [Verrucomicrobiota bacterium]
MSETKNAARSMQPSKLLYIFTRTPLHVGAGASVGAIDQPVQRERHTGFPVIPASSLKGTFADAWLTDDMPRNDKGDRIRVKASKDGGTIIETTPAAWLFGSDDANHAWAGALQFSEAKLLAFPIRSARGSFAWITCPLMLRRAARDGVVPVALLDKLVESADDKAIFDAGANSKLALGDKVVLEEYTFTATPWLGLCKLAEHLAALLDPDDVWKEVASRLVVLSDGMMSFFAQNACEVAQHVRISDETGTAEGGALFNQENVPSETLFYSVMRFFAGRGKKCGEKKPEDAVAEFSKKLAGQVFQFGGDASTGLGYCTVKLS